MKINYNGSLPFEMTLPELCETLDLTLIVEDNSDRQAQNIKDIERALELPLRSEDDLRGLKYSLEYARKNKFSAGLDKIGIGSPFCGVTAADAVRLLAVSISNRSFFYTPNPLESSFGRNIFIPQITIPEPFAELENAIKGSP